MNNYKKSLTILLKRIAYVTISYSLLRFLFLVFQWNAFQDVTFLNFIGGVRFDLSVIFYTNALVIIGHTIPGNFKYTKKYQSILKWVFYISNIVFLCTNFVDFIYYSFTGKRSTYDLITASGMKQEIFKLLPIFLIDFWYIFVITIAFIYFFWKFIPTTKFETKISFTKPFFYLQAILFLTITSSTIIFGRGGLQKYPLRRVDAIRYSNAQNTSLVLNTPFCILRTIGKKKGLEKLKYFSEDKLGTLFSNQKKFNSNKNFSKKNVVFIILESFGNENISHTSPKTGNTPFLDSLIHKSLYFKNGFANGRVSIDAVPSIISGIPSLIGTPYITSTYAFNKTNTLPKILKKEGYYTSFFHGAINGSQNFDQYSKIAGFNNYYGKNEYPNLEHDDGCWGIFDEEYLHYFGEKLSQQQQPFFSSVFTLSSHNPFRIPKKYKDRFKEGPTNFYKSIGYTDYALSHFFDYAKKQDWYHNTLFVITADHSSSAKPITNKTILNKYAIPFLFFDPSNPSLAGVSEKNFQQIDVLPSVLNYLNYNKPFVSYGNSYHEKDNLIINYIQNTYHVILNNYYFTFDGNHILEIYDYKTDVLLKTNILNTTSSNIIEYLETNTKAFLQSFNNNIVDNSMFVN